MFCSGLTISSCCLALRWAVWTFMMYWRFIKQLSCQAHRQKFKKFLLLVRVAQCSRHLFEHVYTNLKVTINLQLSEELMTRRYELFIHLPNMYSRGCSVDARRASCLNNNRARIVTRKHLFSTFTLASRNHRSSDRAEPRGIRGCEIRACVISHTGQ
ncbi:unnamed protein product [Trichogramma brassicae]|uniref:Uncharacterized protein n=1 Tax=Trichogramma brassicae TaxID=86971 RepID=A0A6H5HSN2_9HYME|nr:unnamed protein product [Trichogramma brassicae]